MTTINLKDFYPWYTHDEYIEVSEEVAEELHTSRRREAAHAERVRYNKAFYSLDCDDGIDLAALHQPLNPETILEDSQRRKELLAAIMTLPPKQARRIYARFYLGLDVVEIARKEGVAPANVYASIQHGLSKLRKKIEK